MSTNRNKAWASALLAILIGAWGASAGADKDRGRNWERDRPSNNLKGMVLDRRYDHNRYYPPRGHTVKILPRDHRVIPYRGTRYYFHGGSWYRPSGAHFVVILPPVGLTIPVLPPVYTTIWAEGVPYYYADGVYYRWRPRERTYIVSEPPPESAVATLPPEPEQLFIYPKKGQSEQQLANDRYECHRWGADQSGFDPTQPPGSIAESELAKKRAAYRRAIGACLDARGYSVK